MYFITVLKNQCMMLDYCANELINPHLQAASWITSRIVLKPPQW